MKIKQKKYSELEIDNSEKDMVKVWMYDKGDPQVIHIERDKINDVIVALKACKK